jgi:hypothetical protein
MNFNNNIITNKDDNLEVQVFYLHKKLCKELVTEANAKADVRHFCIALYLILQYRELPYLLEMLKRVQNIQLASIQQIKKQYEVMEEIVNRIRKEHEILPTNIIYSMAMAQLVQVVPPFMIKILQRGTSCDLLKFCDTVTKNINDKKVIDEKIANEAFGEKIKEIKTKARIYNGLAIFMDEKLFRSTADFTERCNKFIKQNAMYFPSVVEIDDLLDPIKIVVHCKKPANLDDNQITIIPNQECIYDRGMIITPEKDKCSKLEEL